MFTAVDVKLFFRVKDVINGGKIVLSTHGKEIFSQKKPILTPGEMQTVILKTTDNISDDVELKVVKE